MPVTPVEEVTGFPECLDGRVKTLHPAVHAGILADRRKPEHVDQLDELGIAPFDLVVVNLYPFSETVASGATPGRVRRADRHRRPGDGARGGEEPPLGRRRRRPGAATPRCSRRSTAGGFTLDERQRLAAAAFRHTATYDVAVASWMGNVAGARRRLRLPGVGRPRAGTAPQVLRYGENPHQRAALYRSRQPGLAHAEQLHGKEMSYNNYVDTDAAWRAAHDHADPCVAIIKHANPCGIAVGRGHRRRRTARRTPATRSRPSAGSSPPTARST